MKKKFLWLAVLLLPAMLAAQPVQNNAKIGFGPTNSWVQTADMSGFEHEISNFMNRWNLPGGSVALLKDGELVYQNGFGKADDSTAALPGHLFRIASLSKPITALAILKLQEEGLLSLDDLVFGSQGLLSGPDFSNFTDPRMGQITVRHLLQHTAGWDRDKSPERDPMFNPVTIAKIMGVPAPAGPTHIISYMLGKPLDFKPGSRFAYSNLGYSILGRVIEQVSGQPYENYVRFGLLAPAGISDIFLARSRYEERALGEVKYYEGNRITRYRNMDGSNIPVPEQYGGICLETLDSNGGWIASAPALARLLSLMSDNPDKERILSEYSLQVMRSASVASPTYGLGLMVSESGNVWHTGVLTGSSAMMALANNGYGWVLLFNGQPFSQQYYRELDQLMWRATAKIKSRPVLTAVAPERIIEPLPQPESTQEKPKRVPMALINRKAAYIGQVW